MYRLDTQDVAFEQTTDQGVEPPRRFGVRAGGEERRYRAMRFSEDVTKVAAFDTAEAAAYWAQGQRGQRPASGLPLIVRENGTIDMPVPVPSTPWRNAWPKEIAAWLDSCRKEIAAALEMLASSMRAEAACGGANE